MDRRLDGPRAGLCSSRSFAIRTELPRLHVSSSSISGCASSRTVQQSERKILLSCAFSFRGTHWQFLWPRVLSRTARPQLLFLVRSGSIHLYIYIYINLLTLYDIDSLFLFIIHLIYFVWCRRYQFLLYRTEQHVGIYAGHTKRAFEPRLENPWQLSKCACAADKREHPCVYTLRNNK
jgi:hypothetical protein